MSYSSNSSLQSFHGMGALGVIPPPFVLMSACDVQLRLITAGKLPRAAGADGQWGPGSRTALTAFARAKGLSLPTIGSRGDYQKMADGRLRIPQAIASALPAKANLTCGAGAAAAPPASIAATIAAVFTPSGVKVDDVLVPASFQPGEPASPGPGAQVAPIPDTELPDPGSADPADPAAPARRATAKSTFPWVWVLGGTAATLALVGTIWAVRSRG
jgi:hypothetical protein